MSVDLGLSGLQESFGKLNCVEDSPTISNPGNTSSSPHASPNLDITNSQLTPEKPANQSFHSFLCIDFESTCINADDPTLNNPTRLSKDQLMWLYPNEIIEWPVILLHDLTGISQPRQLFTPGNQTIWVTDGPWDFRDHFVKSIFLAKRSFPTFAHFHPASLSLFNAMAAFGLEFEGQQHSGIDDAYNVSRLLAEMVKFSTPQAIRPLVGSFGSINLST
ncbi:hypothetical protein PSHT_07501 [Puccinia striiformis]|uniref:Exonuclease domain-containing protein n=1 Tax=Puccinia striiformis TaxID=27350 RepID=A0A2S4VXD7_9BASI|nr:hypothetical protein PSHT_07501 [Puccinia striiformis]